MPTKFTMIQKVFQLFSQVLSHQYLTNVRESIYSYKSTGCIKKRVYGSN